MGVGERGSQAWLWGGNLHRTDSGTAVEGCVGPVPGWGLDSDNLESHRGLLTSGVTGPDPDFRKFNHVSDATGNWKGEGLEVGGRMSLQKLSEEKARRTGSEPPPVIY